jgi:tether containing UBX domain for GLUT4
VALQLPQPEAKEVPGGRLIRKFPSDLTLWKILRQFESTDANAGKNINITARGVAQTANGGLSSGSGQLYYETPVLNILGREFAALTDFQKTLSQLGHNSGNVLIRLTFKKTEQTLFDTMEQISQFFKETEPPVPAEVSVPEQPQESDTPMANAPETATKDEPTEHQAPPDQKTVAEESATTGRDEYEPVNVFLAPSGNTPAAALAPPDETDYTPTIAHAQLHQSRLQNSSRNKRLLSDKELEEKAAEEEARISAINSVLVKVRFPDNTSSDWEIDHSATGAFLYSAVRHVMARPEQPFHLVLPGSKNVIKDDSSPRHNLIHVYKLTGRVLVSLVWEDSVPASQRRLPFLQSNVAKQGQEIKVPEPPKAEADNTATNVAPPSSNDKEDQPKKDGKKMPKWLKLGKK